MDIIRVVCGMYEENAYIVKKEGNDNLLIIDPGDDLEELRLAIARAGGKPEAIALTHGHFDHTLAAGPLAKEYNCPIYAHPGDLEMLEDEKLNAYNREVSRLPSPKGLKVHLYGEEFEAAGIAFKVLNTPGHSEGSVCLYAEEEKVMFSGDTIFRAGFGRMDLAGGSMMSMRNSLRELFDMDHDIKVYPGHGEYTTIGEECGRYRRW